MKTLDEITADLKAAGLPECYTVEYMPPGPKLTEFSEPHGGWVVIVASDGVRSSFDSLDGAAALVRTMSAAWGRPARLQALREVEDLYRDARHLHEFVCGLQGLIAAAEKGGA